MITTGTIDVIDDTIPVEAYCTANNDNDTPIKGPNVAPIDIFCNALISLNAIFTFPHFLIIVKNRLNPIIPEICANILFAIFLPA